MLHEIRVKSVLNKTKRRDPWFLDDYTINPYSACSFNCLYCFIRGSKYGEHMEDRLSVKINALEVLEKQLTARAKKSQFGIIVLSSATDPYLQVEKNLRLTRSILELIYHFKFPVHIITKSDLVLRDFDLLKKINETAILPRDLEPILDQKVFITFSFSTIDDEIGKIFEPGATPPSKRLLALKGTHEANFRCGVSLMPLLPYITDTEDQLDRMFRTFQQIGAEYIFPASITLFGDGPHDGKTLMLTAIEKHYPSLHGKYKQIFSFGHRPPGWYRSAIQKRIDRLLETYHLPTSLTQRASC